MNVYDFDGTIYDGDSSVDFFLYSLRRDPRLIRYLWKQGIGILSHILGRTGEESMKEYFFSFLKSVDDIEAEVAGFWDKHQKKIKKYYLEQQEEEDVIISASPDFLLCDICRRLQVQFLIATRMDGRKGKIDGKNCKGEEKVRRFTQVFGERKIDQFYSDSTADLPMVRISKKAYFVKGKKVVEWKRLGEDGKEGVL